jgi:HK97 family phage portal protein
MKLIPAFFSGMFSRKSMSTHDLFKEIYGSKKSSSGQTVSVDTAVQVSAVFSCCRVIGNGMSQIPLKLMRESGKSRIAAKGHPLYKMLALKPNRWQTSFQYRQMISWHVELCGNHYSFINRIGGEVVELFPLMPNQVSVNEVGRGILEYKVTFEGKEPKTYPASSILHIRGPSWDSVRGIDVLKTAREVIGLALSSDQSASTLHKNGINASGVYSVEGTLKEDQHKLLTAYLLENYGGPENSGKPIIVDRAAKWISTQMTGVDAQALETRKHQIEEVCRVIGVMPIMAGYSDKSATYASAEQMFLAHLVHTMSPRWANFEQALDSQLLTDQEIDDGYYFDFVEEGMIRGSIKDTKDVLLGYVNGGLMTPNEGRAELDLNPDSDPKSDKLRVPANITGLTPVSDSPKG